MAQEKITVSFQLYPEDHERLKEQAKELGLSLSEFIRLSMGVSNTEKKAAKWAAEAVDVKARMKEVARLTAEQAEKDK